MAEEFDKPLNEWIEEDVDVKVMTPTFDPETKKVELKQEIKRVKQKTYYSDSAPTRLVCTDHVYRCIDKGKYKFKCVKCDWHRIALPVSFKFDEATGILTRRDTGVRV